MSVQAISWVIEHSKHKSNPFVVLLMIANHAKSDGSGAWPSISTLAREARIGERTVQRVIARLVRSGELTVGAAKGPYGTNLYALPGVKLTPGGRQFVREGVSPTVTGGVSHTDTLTILEPSLKEKDKPVRRNQRYVSPQDEEKERKDRFKIAARDKRLADEHELQVQIHAGELRYREDSGQAEFMAKFRELAKTKAMS